MIREAKGIALHDLSFWSATLPLLDGLPRVMGDYRRRFDQGIPLSLDKDSGRQVHDDVLRAVQDLADQGQFSDSASVADHLALAVLNVVRSYPVTGAPVVEYPVVGCGVVIESSCDLVWAPCLVELKLTRTEPGLRDVRQVLTYAGLLRFAGRTDLTTGIVVNPRLGVAVEFELEELVLLTSGLSMDGFAELLAGFLFEVGDHD